MHNYSSYHTTGRYKPPQKTKKRRGLRVALLALGVSVLIVATRLLGGTHLALLKLPSGLSRVSASTAKTPLPSLTPEQETRMSVAINKVIQANPDMEIAVVIQDLNSGKSYRYGVSEPFIAASVSKLITATLLLHEVEAGQQSLSEQLSYGSVRYELQQMIEQSDNTAWNDLNSLLTHDSLSQYASQIGLSNYDPDQNTLMVDDIAVLLGKLYKFKLLDKSDTGLLLSYMHDANYDTYIPASVPAGVKVYHKAGWLDDRVHDSAIIDNGNHPYVLVIFTKEADGSDYAYDQGHQIFSDITTATVKAFL